LFKQYAGINLVHVPYKGGGPAAAAILGGEVQISFGSFAATLPQVTANKLRALAVTGVKRASLLPDTPTLDESGFKGYDVTPSSALLAPGTTPKPIIARLNTEMMAIIKLAEVRDAFAKIGIEPTGSTPELLMQIIRIETAMWAKVIKTADIRAE